MLSGLSFAHSLRLPSSSNSMILATVRFFLSSLHHAPLVVRYGNASFCTITALQCHVTPDSFVHRHCLHRVCMRGDTDLPLVISVRATRAFQPTCAYCREKRNTCTRYPSLAPLHLSLSLFAFARSRECRACLFTHIVYIRTTKREGK